MPKKRDKMDPIENTLYFDIREDQWPLVYHPNYNVSFMGLEKFHVFDAKKWGHIVKYLKESGIITGNEIVEPLEAQKGDLLVVHSERYLRSLNWSHNVAMISEIPIIACVPNCCLQPAYLKPMRYQTGGSILAGKLALDRGWAINIGGGFHHCSADNGAGFCPYADITLLITNLFNSNLARKAMIVDLDAHQGNGYARDFLGEERVYIMDMYNCRIYPHDREAKRAIRRKVELKNRCEDLEYMLKLRQNLKEAVKEFHADIVVYNAGTDVLDGDPLGHMYLSEMCVIKRDEFVFETCRTKNIPIVMLTSGGYKRQSARVIADSIINLYKKGYLR